MKNLSKHLVIFLFISFSQTLFSQHKNQHVNSGAIIQAAYQLHDSGKFNLAIDTLLTVDKSDTGYVAVLTELAYSYMMAEKYTEAVKTSNKAFSYPSPNKHRLTLIKGNSFDRWGKTDSSILFFNEALKKYPYSYLIYYNLGVTYTNAKKYSEAVKAYQQAIMINPFHGSSHLGLGRLMAQMGQHVHAILSIETYLLIDPNSARSNPNLVFLNNFVNNALGSDFETIKPVIDNKTFEETDQLIKAGIAMNANFKAKVDFDAPINKQTQLLFESLEYKPNTDDFWMDYYIPVFIAAKENNHFEDLMYTVMTTVPDKHISNQLNKRQKSIKAMNSLLAERLLNHIKTKKVNINGKEQIVDFYLNDDNGILSFGNKKDDVRSGNWRFFYPNYELKVEGGYNNQGKLEGTWKNYDENGDLTYTETYLDGELHGDYIGFYPGGNSRYKAVYNHGVVQGDVTYYYDCNSVSSIVHFDKGYKNGKSKQFYKNGNLLEEYTYVNDSLDGENKAYYPDGTLKWIYYYKNNKLDGKTLDYHNNGKLKYEYEYLNGQPNGQHKSYHYNGKLNITGNFKKGNRVGIWKEYDVRGNTVEITNYNEDGKLFGEDQGFDEGGKPYYIFIHDNGKIKEFKYLDRSGKILVSEKLSDKKTPVKGYYPDGHLLFEGFYTKGKMDGTWTYYYRSGIKQIIKTFAGGNLNGSYESYDKCGRKEVEINYTDDNQDGYYKKYYPNGQISAEGWYVNGNAEGKWYYWHPDGKIDKTLDYFANKINGFEESYSPDQKLQFKSGYASDKITSIVEYDSLGNEITDLVFDGKQDYVLHYFDKKIRLKSNFPCNDFNSKFEFYDRSGKVDSEFNYLNGSKDGNSTSYFANGKIKKEGSFKEGNSSGFWKYYYENGGLSKTGYFLNDNKDSIWIGYHENGKIKYVTQYSNNELTDTAKYFDSPGEFMYSLVYNKFGLVSYQYLSSDGLISKIINPKDTGIIVTYYKNGKKSSEQSLKFGVLEGKQTFYYSNGNKYQEYNLVNDQYHGKYAKYYDNGKLKSVENYQYSLEHGTHQYFRPDGSLEHTEDYNNGSEHGSFSYFDNHGKKIKENKYWSSISLD